jgi:hypothetical protein
VRPALTIVPGGRYEDIDLVLIRENTEGLYVGVEHYIGMDGDPRAAAESVMIITRFGAERIVRYAFEYARANGRKKVTLAHKANILKYTQGLFLDVGREVARSTRRDRVRGPDHRRDGDAARAGPVRFDVLVMENMFGDILSRPDGGLVGGLGFAPGGQHRQGRRDVRGRARLGAGHRGEGHREPDRAAPRGVHDARSRGPARDRGTASAPRSAVMRAGDVRTATSEGRRPPRNSPNALVRARASTSTTSIRSSPRRSG